MGILNLTPDSFSDGGRYLALDAAVAQGRRLIAQGADILDLGGESTRPGAAPVSAQAEIARVAPVIAALARDGAPPLSVDTMKPEVARAAMAAGATIWNDVTALRYAPDAPDVAAELGCQMVLMHMQGEPRTMQAAPHYEDVTAEVCAFLVGRAEAALAAGVARDKIWLDPGIGFGKTLDHNLTLLARLDAVCALGFPVLLGASRKRFIATLHPAAEAPDARAPGSIAAALAGAAAGVAAVRVHDVGETAQALDVWSAIRAAGSA
ncbi:dihydropteroate synthase [Phenylobacterium sp.]|uniref:dihydropteroate synthase n=1 Tax=Phenylobacterium sp. TaxID=1871053 RepID=UPI002731CFDC|nr:dihydropteroate synthase [Phenylobacterium sp.]MDP1872766.1 dihydropteroate synthase [Phenylobacterium sp.]MDP3300163.1 dihydropteroate synthase [Phenylobacterium sp.]